MAALRITNREFFVPLILVTSYLPWVFTITCPPNVAVDALPIIAFLFQLGVRPWRKPENDIHALLLFYASSISATRRSLRGIGSWANGDVRVRLWWTGVVGQAISMTAYYYTNGADILPVVAEIRTAGLKDFDLAKVRVGMETFKCIVLLLSLLDIGRLPRNVCQTVLVKAAQIAFLWIGYAVWDMANPSSEIDPSITTIVRGAVQKSKPLELVVVLRTISILFNWTAFRPPALRAQPAEGHGSPPPSPGGNQIPDSVVEQQGNLTCRRTTSTHASGSIPAPQQQFPLRGVVVDPIRWPEPVQIEPPDAELSELAVGHIAGQSPGAERARRLFVTVSRAYLNFSRLWHSRNQRLRNN